MFSASQIFKNIFRTTNRRRSVRRRSASVPFAVERMESRMLLSAVTVDGVAGTNPPNTFEVIIGSEGGSSDLYLPTGSESIVSDSGNVVAGIMDPEDCSDVVAGITAEGPIDDDPSGSIVRLSDSVSLQEGGIAMNAGDSPAVVGGTLCGAYVHAVDSYFAGIVAEYPMGLSSAVTGASPNDSIDSSHTELFTYDASEAELTAGGAEEALPIDQLDWQFTVDTEMFNY